MSRYLVTVRECDLPIALRSESLVERTQKSETETKQSRSSSERETEGARGFKAGCALSLADNFPFVPTPPRDLLIGLA